MFKVNKTCYKIIYKVRKTQYLIFYSILGYITILLPIQHIKRYSCLLTEILVIVITQTGCLAIEMLLKEPPGESRDFLTVDIGTLNNKNSCIKIGLKLINSGKYTKAIEAFQKALELDPNNAGANNYLGRAYFLYSDNAKAKMFLEISISLKRDYADAYYNLGDVYLREGNLALAMKYYKTAIQINEGYRNNKRNFFGEDFIPLY